MLGSVFCTPIITFLPAHFCVIVCKYENFNRHRHLPARYRRPGPICQKPRRNMAKGGESVKVKAFRIERKLPTGLRHFFYFFKILPAVFWCDFIIALDTWSVALPESWRRNLFGKNLLSGQAEIFSGNHTLKEPASLFC